MRAGFASLFFCCCGVAAHAEDANGLSGDCETLVSALGDAFAALEFVSCETDTHQQVRAEAVYAVDRADVVGWAELLRAQYGMGEVRFVCCGYEAHPTGFLPVPEDVPAFEVETSGSVPGISIFLVAPGLDEDGEVLGLGEADAAIVLRWIEV